MASPTETVVGVIALDEDSKRAMERLSDALTSAGITPADVAPETKGDDRPTEPQIIAWPQRTQPPTLIVRCPMCDASVETEPLSWEIVIDPTSTADAVSVRGLVHHAHEDTQTDVRWPFAAVWTPPPVTISDVQRTFAWQPDEHDDIEEGQAKRADDDFEFTPDDPREPVSLKSAVYQALGAASTSWLGERPQGTFDSTRALAIGEALLEVVERFVDERVQSAEDERTRLDQIIYRARAVLSEAGASGLRTTTLRDLASAAGQVSSILAAVDGPDSPAAKRLRGEA